MPTSSTRHRTKTNNTTNQHITLKRPEQYDSAMYWVIK